MIPCAPLGPCHITDTTEGPATFFAAQGFIPALDNLSTCMSHPIRICLMLAHPTAANSAESNELDCMLCYAMQNITQACRAYFSL